MLLFGKLAKNWPSLMTQWSKVDLELSKRYSYPKKIDFNLRMITGLMMGLALGILI